MEPTAHFNRVEHPCRASRSLTVSIPYFSRLFSHPQPLCPPLPHSHSFVQSFSSVHSRNLTVPQYPSFLSLSHSLSLSCILLPGVPTNSSTPQKRKTRGIYYSFALCVCSGGAEGATYPKIAEKTFGTGCLCIISANVSKGFDIFTR